MADLDMRFSDGEIELLLRVKGSASEFPGVCSEFKHEMLGLKRSVCMMLLKRCLINSCFQMMCEIVGISHGIAGAQEI